MKTLQDLGILLNTVEANRPCSSGAEAVQGCLEAKEGFGR